MKNPVLIIGAGGLGKAALDIFNSNGVVVYGFLDDDPALKGKEIDGISILGSADEEQYLELIGKKCEAFVAIDENEYRKKLVKALKEKRQTMPANAIHQRAYIAASAYLGHGNFINASATLGAGSKIGSHCIINAYALVDYNAELGDFVQVGAGSVVNAGVKVENEAFIGSGATVISGVKIGKRARIGAGSVVISDVEEDSTVFGNPAKPIDVK